MLSSLHFHTKVCVARIRPPYSHRNQTYGSIYAELLINGPGCSCLPFNGTRWIPICHPGDESSIGSATDLTEVSSVADGDWASADEDFASTASLTHGHLEHISKDLASRGPLRSQLQLRLVGKALTDAIIEKWHGNPVAAMKSVIFRRVTGTPRSCD